MMSFAINSRILRRIRLIALPALIFLIGFQTLRILFPSVAYYLNESLRAGIGPVTLVAVGTILMGFLAPLLWRTLGQRTGLWITVGGLMVIRFVMQLIRRPDLDVWLSMAGVSLFAISVPLLVGHMRCQNSRLAGTRIAFGVLLALALDSGIRGATWTLDLIWIPGPIPLLFIAGTCLLCLWLLSVEFRGQERGPAEVGWRSATPWLGFGPMLLLQMVLFQNQGWIATMAQATAQAAFLVVMLGDLLAAIGASLAFARPRLFHPAAALLGTTVFLFAAHDQFGGPALYLILAGLNQLFWGWGLALIATLIAPARRNGLLHTTWSLVGAFFLFVAFAFLYYAPLEIRIPLPRDAILDLAALLAGTALIAATARVRVGHVTSRNELPMALPATLLLLIPLAQIITSREAPPAPDRPGPITAMTYNIHSAFDPHGRQRPEAIAQIIVESNAQIVGLQEVSRGWLINGSTDLAAWLSHHLEMHMIFSGTAGPMWGNALLTRFPILAQGAVSLPSDGAILDRGFLWARLSVPGGDSLLVIVTHLHHIEADREIRQHQLATILGWWAQRPKTVLVGDLNSEPGSSEIRALIQAGLQDAWARPGFGAGYTSPALGPHERIDWIWLSSDLTPIDAQVPGQVASDHLPLVATFRE
jgi:endonuclease/exonuclease/phosphatase family metal-dependent hydrolase